MSELISYRLVAEADEFDRLHLVTEARFRDVRQRILEAVFDAREQAIREHLIKLGWTPPTKAATPPDISMKPWTGEVTLLGVSVEKLAVVIDWFNECTGENIGDLSGADLRARLKYLSNP